MLDLSTSTPSSWLTPTVLLFQLMSPLLLLPVLTTWLPRDNSSPMLQLSPMVLLQLLQLPTLLLQPMDMLVLSTSTPSWWLTLTVLLSLLMSPLLLLPVLTIWPPRDCMVESTPRLLQLSTLLVTLLDSRHSPMELLSPLMSQLWLLPALTTSLPSPLPTRREQIVI